MILLSEVLSFIFLNASIARLIHSSFRTSTALIVDSKGEFRGETEARGSVEGSAILVGVLV